MLLLRMPKHDVAVDNSVPESARPSESGRPLQSQAALPPQNWCIALVHHYVFQELSYYLSSIDWPTAEQAVFEGWLTHTSIFDQLMLGGEGVVLVSQVRAVFPVIVVRR